MARFFDRAQMTPRVGLPWLGLGHPRTTQDQMRLVKVVPSTNRDSELTNVLSQVYRVTIRWLIVVIRSDYTQ